MKLGEHQTYWNRPKIEYLKTFWMRDLSKMITANKLVKQRVSNHILVSMGITQLNGEHLTRL